MPSLVLPPAFDVDVHMVNIPAEQLNEDSAPVRGARLVSLTARVLRSLAELHRSSCRIADVVEHTGIERGTVNRVLRALCAEGLARREADGRSYRLGPLSFELGLIAEMRLPWRNVVQPAMERIAAETGDTCFFMIRSGQDAVCLARGEGSYPVRAFTMDVGNRRPLGAAAGSVALLMYLPPAECEAYLRKHAHRIKGLGLLTADAVRAMVVRARKLGFALSHDEILPEVSSVGVAIPARWGTPYAALSVAAVTSRIMPNDRYRDIARLLQEVGKSLALELQAFA